MQGRMVYLLASVKAALASVRIARRVRGLI
jgi:hypothetical protein